MKKYLMSCFQLTPAVLQDEIDLEELPENVKERAELDFELHSSHQRCSFAFAMFLVELGWAIFHSFTFAKRSDNSVPLVLIMVQVLLGLAFTLTFKTVLWRAAREDQQACTKDRLRRVRRFAWCLTVNLWLTMLNLAAINETTQMWIYNAWPDLLSTLREEPLCKSWYAVGCGEIPDKANTQMAIMALTWLILLVLPARHALMSSLPCVAFYALLVWLMNGNLGFGYTEVLMMSMAAVVATLAACLKNQLHLQLFFVLSAYKQQMIAERLMRAKEEFKNETLMQKMNGSEDISGHINSIDHAQSRMIGANRSKKTRVFDERSCFSAPAKADRLACNVGANYCNGKMEGDCLPGDVLAQVENTSEPIQIRFLEPGQRVLCHDHITDTVRFVEVTSTSTTHEDVEWLVVTLIDGSTMRMTRDHPLRCKEEGEDIQQALRAEDLVPGKHCLVRLKAEEVSIAHTKLDKVHGSSRVSITLQQPDRYSLLAQSSSRGPLLSNAIAVGSADLAPWTAQLKRTFFNITATDLEAMQRPAMRRTHSAPGVLAQAKTDCVMVNEMRHWRLQNQKLQKEVVETSWRSSSKTGSSDCSNIQFQIGALNLQREADNVLLSDMTDLKAANIRSCGGRRHGSYDCCDSVCSFQHAFVHPRGDHQPDACRAGELCNFCHEDHNPRMRRSRRYGAESVKALRMEYFEDKDAKKASAKPKAPMPVGYLQTSLEL